MSGQPLELSTFREDDRGEDDRAEATTRSSSPAAPLLPHVYSARDHDYNLVIVRDACSNSHDDSMAALMNTVFPRLARVRSTDRVLEIIRNGNE